MIDNGKDYRSRDFSGGRKTVKVQVDEVKAASLLRGCEITPHFALPYNAQTKPIERSFLKNKEWLSKNMPGYRGGNTTERPESLKQERKQGTILEWEQFEKNVDNYMENIHNRTPSEGKNLGGMSPDELWDKEATTIKKARPSSLKMLCMRSSKPITVGRNGIKDPDYPITYWGEWMPAHKGTSVYIRRDSKAFQTAWIFTADDKDQYLGEATMTQRPAALAETDIEKAVFKENLARKRHDLKATKLAAGNINRAAPEDLIKNMAIGVQLLNDKRGYRPGGMQEPVIEIQRTAADEAIRERERQAKLGTCDFTKIAPPARQKKERKYFVLPAQKKRDEQLKQEEEEAQTNL